MSDIKDWQVVDTYDEDQKIIIWDGDEQAHAPICDMGEIGDMNYSDVLKKAKLIEAAPKLRDAVFQAVTALEWKQENQPTLFDKADSEKLYEWKQLLNNL